MAEKEAPTQEEIDKLTSSKSFSDRYHRVLRELDALYRGVFDETEAESASALCLLAQAALVKELSAAEFRARACKRDIDFAKAEAYHRIKKEGDGDGKKVTDVGSAHLLNKDEKVMTLSAEQNKAEREAKEYSNILSILKDAHITFRSLGRKS